MNKLGLLIGILALGWCSGEWNAVAETRSAFESDASGWVELHPDAHLTGWKRLPIPGTNSLGRQQWHMDKSGVLVCDGDGGHDMLQYEQVLTDGIFHVEFRFAPAKGTNPKYNSGVFIRNSADGVVWHQAQLSMDGGYLFGNSPVKGTNQRFKTSPSERRVKPAGEWNSLELTARGKVLSVWLNGAETCVYDQCGVPTGFIALEAEGYRIEFRHLRYKPLP